MINHFDPPSIAAAVFDIGGVFLYPNPEPVRERQIELGLEPSSDDIAYRQAHHAGCAALSARFAAAQDGVNEHATDFWVDYDRAYAQSLEVPEELAGECRVAIRVSWDWPHQENIASFHQLAESGLPVAIVSNNDGSAQQSMIDFGVGQVGHGPLPHLHAVVDSGVLGISKPDPAIMAPALEALAIDPARVLYIGDTVHADIVGATNAGMQSVQLDPFNHHADYGHTRVADLAALADLLLDV